MEKKVLIQNLFNIIVEAKNWLFPVANTSFPKGVLFSI